jgi:hypothetical protein
MWVPSWSKSTRTCWAVVADNHCEEAYQAIYVPPLNDNHTEQDRAAFLRQCFQEVAEVKRIKPNMRIHMCGDFNPTPCLMHELWSLAAAADMHPALPDNVPTHIQGGHLDLVWQLHAGHGHLMDAVVHNGIHCAARGCKASTCKQFRAEVIRHSAGEARVDQRPTVGLDIDHAFTTFLSPGCRLMMQ